ncbi:MAG: amidase [Ectothiorhodospiraceae bacterium]|nr:amidase [Ectothiorhodospiraceae bacterium]
MPVLTLAEASRRIAAGELSPVELTRSCLDRIASLDPILHAFITVTADQAMVAAREAERAITRDGPRSPLHGIPFGLKDIYDTRGIATTGHSRLTRTRVPDADSACTERLLDAGAILLGKLATHEFATGGPSYDLPWPPARNPWCLDRFPGGSSSGSGAAVASGMLPLAMGSDTGGSIRLPAAFCGIAGLKPTYGRVPKRGVLPLSWTLDNCGPLAWTAEDCAIALTALAGFDPADPGSASRPVVDVETGLGDGVAGLVIGVAPALYAQADADTQAAMAASLDVLTHLGARVVEVSLPSIDDYQAVYRVIAMAEAFAIHEADLRERPDHYGAVFRYRIMPGAFVSAAEYVDALRMQRELLDATLRVLDGLDALVAATTYGGAPVQATMRAEANFARPPLTNPFNIAQCPAISVCNGFSTDGLPLAMQVVGRPFDEATVLRVAHAYERATPWRERRPTIDPAAAVVEPEPVDPRATRPADPTGDALTADCVALGRRAGLTLDPRQLADLRESQPHVDAMVARVRRRRAHGAEPSLAMRFPPEDLPDA